MTDSFDFKTYKHVFTSLSSVEKRPKATRSGNARIHGMTSVTPASIAYIATQVSDTLSFLMMNVDLSSAGPIRSQFGIRLF